MGDDFGGEKIMFRFFAISEEEHGLLLSQEDGHHIQRVLRLDEGEMVEGVYQGNLYQGRLLFLDHKTYVVQGTWMEDDGRNLTVILCQGIPKGQKMEEIIRHGTEVGVDVFLPLALKRCISQISAKEEKKLKRWRGVAESGAKQSKALHIPEILEPMTLKEALEFLKDSLMIVAYEEEKTMRISSILQGKKPKKVAIFIGPEGGFEKEEVEMILEAGGVSTSLGSQILRTETAGVIASFLVRYELEMRGWNE